MSHGIPVPARAAQRAFIAVGDTIRAQVPIMGYADCFVLLGVEPFVLALLKKGVACSVGVYWSTPPLVEALFADVGWREADRRAGPAGSAGH